LLLSLGDAGSAPAGLLAHGLRVPFETGNLSCLADWAKVNPERFNNSILDQLQTVGSVTFLVAEIPLPDKVLSAAGALSWWRHQLLLSLLLEQLAFQPSPQQPNKFSYCNYRVPC
jgi:hypothetical protein